jgi:divalent metal cation (Fe/Co/Zn/Cd) transporter
VALLLGKGYESADDWAALFASGFILFNAYLIFRPALGEIMDEHVHDDLIEKIRATSNQKELLILKNASSVKGNEISCGLA